MLRAVSGSSRGRYWSSDLMREELSDALAEALHELQLLPKNPDGALVGLYAVMDDVQAAIQRTQALDLTRSVA